MASELGSSAGIQSAWCRNAPSGPLVVLTVCPREGFRTITRGVAYQERITGRQSSNRSFGFLDHTFQSGYLSEEFHSRLRGTAEQHCAGRYVGNHPRLCANLRPLPDPQVPSHGSLAADLNEILKDRGAAIPTWATMTQQRPSRTLWPIWTRLSRREPAPMMVSRVEPLSIVVLAPTSTSSSTITRPNCGMLRNPTLMVAKLNPSCPIRAPGYMNTRAPRRAWLRLA